MMQPRRHRTPTTAAHGTNQATSKWHNEIRYGGLRLNSQFDDFAPTGIPDAFGDYLGAPITINGGNGYNVTGQAIFQFGGQQYPNQFAAITSRDFVYAQTDYRINPHIVALGGFKYEAERGSTQSTGSPASIINRGNYSYTLQISGDIRNRFYYNLGSGIENNGLFGLAGTPTRLGRLLSRATLGDGLAQRNQAARELW